MTKRSGPPRRRRWSLRARALAVGASFALPAAALQALQGFRAYADARASAIAEARGAAQQVAAAVDATLSAARDLTAGVAAAGPEVLLVPERCTPVVRVSLDVFPTFLGVAVVDASGTVVCSALPLPEGARPSAADRRWFQELMASGAFTISEPLVGRIRQGRVVILASPVRDEEGRVVGAVSGGLELERLVQLMRDFLQSRDAGIATIIDDSDVIVARTRDLERWVGVRVDRDADPPVASGAGWQVFETEDLAGEARLFGRVDLPEFGWRVYVSFPRAALLDARYARARDAVWLGLFLLALGVGFALLAYRAVTRPLTSLAAQIQALGEGGRIRDVDDLPPELAEVAEALNQALEARARADERYLDFLTNAPFGVFISTRDGRFIFVNPRMAEILGYDGPEDLRQAGVLAVFRSPQERERLLQRYLQEGGMHGLEWELVRKDGTPVPVLISGRRRDDPRYGVVFEGVIQDLSEQRRLQEIQRQQQKGETVGRMAGGLAHELNNVLTVVRGHAELLRQELEGTPLADDVRQIEEAADRATDFTRRILAISRRDPVRNERVELGPFLEELEGTLRRIVPAHVELMVERRAGCGAVFMHPGQLEQVVLNLAINARDAMPRGGRLTLCCEGAEKDGAPWVCIVVEDTGEGMTPEVQARIFEPFFSTKPPEKGSGLGLATSLGIVEQAGGTIRVFSEPGRGTRFEVWLPAHGA